MNFFAEIHFVRWQRASIIVWIDNKDVGPWSTAPNKSARCIKSSILWCATDSPEVTRCFNYWRFSTVTWTITFFVPMKLGSGPLLVSSYYDSTALPRLQKPFAALRPNVNDFFTRGYILSFILRFWFSFYLYSCLLHCYEQYWPQIKHL